jgi:hypothetical protein
MIPRILAQEGAPGDISLLGCIDSRTRTNRGQPRRSIPRRCTAPRFPSTRWQHLPLDVTCGGQWCSSVGSAYHEVGAGALGPAYECALEGARERRRVNTDADHLPRRRSAGQRMMVRNYLFGAAERSAGRPRHQPTRTAAATQTLGRQNVRAAFLGWREYPAHRTRLSRGKGKMGPPEAVSDVKNRGRGHLCYLARRTRRDTTWTGSSVDWTPARRTS